MRYLRLRPSRAVMLVGPPPVCVRGLIPARHIRRHCKRDRRVVYWSTLNEVPRVVFDIQEVVVPRTLR